MHKSFTAQDRIPAARLTGRAFRFPDGIVRWITQLSTRGYFTLLWLDERTNRWQSGGAIHYQDWLEQASAAQEVKAPEPGETFLYVGALGGVRKCVA